MAANPSPSHFTISRFWTTHALFPALLFVIAVIIFEFTAIDVSLANHFYDFTTQQWPHKNSGWASQLIHEYGRRMIVALFLINLVALLLTWLRSGMKPYRRPAAYMALVLIFAPLIVSSGKHISNVDCPWDLNIYGGDRPHILLFQDRPDDLPATQCFPGGHSSSGFALLGLYFLLLKRNTRLAKLGLAIGLGVGSLFAFGQEARGAHFISHDAWSAFICWFTALVIYTVIFRQRLWSD